MAEEFDPFSGAPEDDAPKEPTPAPKKTTTRKPRTTPTTAKESTVTENVTNNNGLSLTFKGGVGFDSPWIVNHVATLEEAAEFLGIDVADYPDRKDLLKAVFAATWNAATFFQAQAPEKPAAAPKAAAQGNGGGNSAPARQQAPGGEGRQCVHGDMVFRSGVTQSGKNAGKTWKAFMCPAPKGAAQCDPEWIK